MTCHDDAFFPDWIPSGDLTRFLLKASGLYVLTLYFVDGMHPYDLTRFLFKDPALKIGGQGKESLAKKNLAKIPTR